MLVIRRKHGEIIDVTVNGTTFEIHTRDVRGRLSLGFVAPRSVRIARREVSEREAEDTTLTPEGASV